MTQRALINNCYVKGIQCEKCKPVYRKACEKYKEKYGEIPYEADEEHPERYTNEEI